jgi:thiol-disulfide isomerase/thioredoxin
VAAVVGGLLLVAVVLAILLAGNSTEPDTTPLPENPEVIVTGTALPAFPTEGLDSAEGLAAPELSGVDLDGKPLSIAADGRPKALLFLAHWCPHCQAEVPRFLAYVEANGFPSGIDLYGIATSNDPLQANYPPDAWLEREGWTAPVLLDDQFGSAANAYGLVSFPYWVFVDADGNVVARFTGEQDPAGMVDLMKSLIP